MNRHFSFVRMLLTVTAFALCGTLAGCGEGPHMKPPVVDLGGDDVDDDHLPGSLEGYPKGLSVVPFTDKLKDGKECLGFYAVVDFAKNPKLRFRPQLSRSKVPTSYFTDFKEGTPLVVVNGGYFNNGSLSLLFDSGVMKSPAPRNDNGYDGKNGEQSPRIPYQVARAALGLMKDGSFEATWVCLIGTSHYSLPKALDNDESKSIQAPAPTLSLPGIKPWEPKDAIGGGPMLVYDGKNVAAENTDREVVRDKRPRNPRTAIGFTADGKLILLVCDGRDKRHSAGFNFVELADKMATLGCTYAINLDGGGSSAIVGREGTVLNVPSNSKDEQRAVPTAIVIAETK